MTDRLATFQLNPWVITDRFEPDFEQRLYRLLTDPRLRHMVTIASGLRTYAQQKDLYDRWRAGTYNVKVVARPGTSRHETGRAADLDIGWGAPFGWPHVHAVAAEYGLHFPVNGEAWHVETNPKAPPLEDDMDPEDRRMLKAIYDGMYTRAGLNPDADHFGLAILATNYTVQNALTVDGRNPYLPGQIQPSAPVDVAALVDALAPMLIDAMKKQGPLELDEIETAVKKALAKAKFTF